jgi:hypothetical protein
VTRPDLTPADRDVLAALSRLIRRRAWGCGCRALVHPLDQQLRRSDPMNDCLYLNAFNKSLNGFKGDVPGT